jgi:hypothetical protein
MTTKPITSHDLLEAADHCAAGLLRAASIGWSAPVPGLDWDVRTTIEHLVDVLGFYTLHLVAASPGRLRVDVTCHADISNDEVVHMLTIEAGGLATAARVLEPTTQAFHFHGTTDVSGFLALACSELLVHTGDAFRGLGGVLEPRPDLAAKVLQRLFPSAPSDADPWRTLQWATGRGRLPGLPEVGPDWSYRTAPLP